MVSDARLKSIASLLNAVADAGCVAIGAVGSLVTWAHDRGFGLSAGR
jgi:hypothetical protein